MSSSGSTLCEPRNQTSRPADATTIARFSQLRPGSMSGAERIRVDSLRYATIDPVNVTAPISTPRNTSTRCAGSAGSVRNELNPTSTAASPTNECSTAMSSGICVISTLRARQVPTLAPMRRATRISAPVTAAGRCERSRARAIVATSASAMPTIPATLPRRAVSCLDRPARDRTKSTAART